MKRFRVVFSPEARRHVVTIDAWWRVHRDKAPGLFRRELTAAVRQLRSAPTASIAYDGSPVLGTRRLLLPRTRHHVYFVIDEESAVVGIRAVWHASRGAGPM